MTNRWNSFKSAFAGIYFALKSEWNLRFHLIVSFFVIVSGFFFKLNLLEFFMVLVCIVLVIGFELINTSIEKLCDFIHPQKHETIGKIKDISAGAVLVIAIFSLIVGSAIFTSKIFG